MDIPENIKKWRQRRGLSIKEVAEFLEIPESTYRGYEYGSKLPALLVPKLCGILSLPLEEFFSNPDEPRIFSGEKDIQNTIYLMENGLNEIKKYINDKN